MTATPTLTAAELQAQAERNRQNQADHRARKAARRFELVDRPRLERLARKYDLACDADDCGLLGNCQFPNGRFCTAHQSLGRCS